MSENAQRLPTMEEIVRACSRYFGVPAQQIRGPRQQPQLIRARHMAMFLCRVDARRSYPEIGRFFDRDHTTVMDADRKIFRGRERKDAQLEEDLRQIRNLFETVQGTTPEPTECAGCRTLQAENERLRQELAAAKQECMVLRVRFGCY